ncbi:hypothetical protein CCAND95_720007 [Capnocytophaga canis]|uniref:Lipoprotein n=1 Tax=Capnocytophaga canis TaxID=1848903 RepID=A0A0B7IGF5_9FLAO|nr:hypothetical protein [Capnocytophaga canis]CEN46550.1 hypothetical protein CCAND95_720007 [Capnocytophaga canis]CEN48763.1 hypothetical protein CCAND38_650002 [Capnocytophaga canis]CEN51001.1 hypothetical protein CCAND93_130007 [Capnocytophaga canis]
MKNIFYILVCLTLQGCHFSNDVKKDKILFNIASDGIKQFYSSFIENPQNADSLVLFETFQKIQNTGYLGNINISYPTSAKVYELFMMLDKFEDAERLLEDDKVSFKDRNFYRNYTKAIHYYHTNREKSHFFAQEGLKDIKMVIKSKNIDDKFSAYGRYFYMRTFLVGKEKVLQEIDSMQKVNKTFSEIEYEAGFKDGVEELVNRYRIDK